MRGLDGRAALVAVLLGFVILTTVLPADALHYGSSAPDPPEIGPPRHLPRTGFVEPDQRLSELYSQGTETIENFEAHAQQALGSVAGQAPVRPIEILRDDGRPGERHGGIGPTEHPAEWHRHNASGRGWTWRFGNATTGTYPSTPSATLLSPVIDLSTLGSYTDLVPGWRDLGSPHESDLFTLFLVHRFDLADAPGRGLDGGRVKVFLDGTQPGEGDAGTLVEPDAGPEYRDYVQALGGEGFSGATNWTVSSFDLSAWAGHRIRMGIEVATVPFAEGSDRFEDEELFHNSQSKGWLIDEIRVRGPAIADNVQVQPFASPAKGSEETMPHVDRGEATHVRVPVVNLGSNSQRLNLEHRITENHPDTRGGPGEQFHRETETVELDPGEVHAFEDRSWGASEKDVVWLGLEARSPGSSASLPVRTVGVDSPDRWTPLAIDHTPHLQGAFDVEPVIGTEGDERRATFSVQNRGPSPDSVSWSIDVHHRPSADDQWEEVSEDVLGDQALEGTVHVPSEGNASVTWNLAPTDRGAYRLDLEHSSLEPHANGSLTRDREAIVHVDTGAQARSLPSIGREDPCRSGDAKCSVPAPAPSPTPDILGADGAYWVSPKTTLRTVGTDPLKSLGAPSPRIDLVGTPSEPCPRLREAVGNASDETTEDTPVNETGDELLAGASHCQLKLQERVRRVLQDTEAGPEGPIDALLPGHMDLELTARYRTINVPLDQPPEIHVEMANYDPIRSYFWTGEATGLTAGLPSPEEEVLEEPVHATIELPVSNGTSDSGLLGQRVGAGWRQVHVDLDQRLKQATGVKDVWELGLEEVRVVAPETGNSDKRDQLLLDHLEVTGVPVSQPTERETLLRTTGDSSERVGEWACRANATSLPRRQAPEIGGCGIGETIEGFWRTTTAEGAATAAADDWHSADGALEYRPSTDPWADTRFVTDNVTIPDEGSPQLVLQHSYATPASGFTGDADNPAYYLGVGYVVELQYWQGNEWSPFYLLTPSDGYPTPHLTVPTGERRSLATGEYGSHCPPCLRAGEAFYWPSGKIDVPAPLGDFEQPQEVDGSPTLVHRFPLESTGTLAPPVDLDGRTVRFAFHSIVEDTTDFGPVSTQAENTRWRIERAEVWNRTPLPRNVGLAETHLGDDGNSRTRFGPGAEVPVTAVAENTGRLDAGPVDVTLVVTDESGDTKEETRTIRLPAGANRTVTFPWSVPEDAEDGETFRFELGVATTEVEDLSTLDDEETVGPVVVQANPDVAVRSSMSPSMGTVGSVVSLRTTVENTGTTPIEDTEMRRNIWRLGSSPLLVRQDTWSLSEEVQPSTGSLSPSTDFEATHRSTPEDREANRWTPSQPGTYRVATEVVAQSRGANGDTVELVDRHDEVMQVLDTTFRDGFEGQREGGKPGSQWTTTGEGWSLRDDAGFRSSTSWWVGGADGYPHEADTALASPQVDLSSAKAAFLTLAMNYSTERFFDGAAVEASTDGGETWSTLVPASDSGSNRYPDPLSPANPAGDRDEEGNPLGGFSGTPSPDDRIDGWTHHTFPLAQLDDLTGTETLLDLIPPSSDEGSLEELGHLYTRPSWALGTGPSAKRFLVENLTETQPRPQTGGTMWYTGAVGNPSRDTYETTLELELSAPELGDPGRNRLQVRFDDWRPGVTESDPSGVGGSFEITATGAEAEVATKDGLVEEAWTRRWVNLSEGNPEDDTVRLRFGYESSNCPDPSGCDWPEATNSFADNRGWAIDNVTVAYIGEAGQVTEVLASDLSERDRRWTILDSDTSPIRWERSQSPDPVDGDWRARETDDDVQWTLSPPGGELTLPANQQSRLVSPTIDLRGVGEREVRLELDHEYKFQQRSWTVDDLPLVEGGVLEVQIYNETSQSFEPWRTLFEQPLDLEGRRLYDPSCVAQWSSTGISPEQRCFILPVDGTTVRDERLADAIGYDAAVRGVGLPFDHVRMNFTGQANGDSTSIGNVTEPVTFIFTGERSEETTFDLGWLTGKRFRLGFHSWANPSEQTLEEQESWTIRDAEVVMETFDADTVQTRVRFGSDGSVAGDHVAVDDVAISQLSYDRNLQLRVHENETARSLEPGSVTWVNGTVENRGRAARDGFAVRVDGTGLPDGIRNAQGNASANGTGSLPTITEPMSVAPAGTSGAESSFAIPLYVPADASSAAGELEIRVVDVDPDDPNATRARPITDEVAGNKASRLPLTVGEITNATVDLTITPTRLRAGETANAHVVVENAGTVPISPRLFVNRTWPLGETAPVESRTLDLPPGASAPVDLSLTPSSSGIHRVHATLVGSHGLDRISAELPVNASTAPLSTAWESDQSYDRWGPPAAARGQCMDPSPVDTDAPPTPRSDWSRAAGQGVGGSLGLLFGEPEESPSPPDGYLDSGFVTRSVNLSPIEDPAMTFVHRPHFPTPGAGAVVEVRVLNETTREPMYQVGDAGANCRGPQTSTPNENGWFLLRPTDGYDHRSLSFPGSPPANGVGSETPSDLSPLGDDHPIVGGVSEGWRQFRADLTDQAIRPPGGGTIDLSEEIVEFRLRGTTREESTEPGEGWNVDGFVVGSGGLDVAPDQAERTIVDGAEKELGLDIGNPGDTRDAFNVEVAESGTTLPLEWFELEDTSVDVPAGQTRPLNATLEIPVSENNQQASYRLLLAVRSAYDPALIDFVEYTINVVPDLHSNLGVQLSTSGDQVEVGGNTLLSATVTNTGSRPSPRAEAAFWVEDPAGNREVLGTREIPSIEPSRGGHTDSVSLTVPWTAPEGPLGEYAFGVHVDPDDRIVEFNESDNGAADTIRVTPLQRPDLVVEPDDLRVLSVDGSQIDAADPGDLVQVLVSVSNDGNEPARRVEVSLAMGPEPVAQRTIDRLPAGQTETFPFTVFAPGDSTVLSLDVSTLASELDEDNNRARVELPIRDAQIALKPIEDEVRLAPGDETVHRLKLSNQASKTKVVRLDSADRSFSLETAEEEILLPPGEARTVEASVGVAPALPPGSHELPIRLTDLAAERSATLAVPVTVAEKPGLTVDVPDTKAVRLGAAPLPIRVENTGNVPLTTEIAAEAPAGWGDPSIGATLLEPGETRRTSATLTPPNGTQPGPQEVAVHVTAREGPSLERNSTIHVEPTARTSLETRAVSAGSHPVVFEIQVKNTGNVPARTALDVLETPIGWSLRASGSVADLAPGETNTATLELTPEAEGAPKTGSFLLGTRLSPDASVDQPSTSRTFTGALNAMPPDVAVTSADATPRYDVTEGEEVSYAVTVENRGAGPAAPVPVRLYQSERLADAGEIGELPAGEERTVNLTLRAGDGLQTVVASADPHGRLLDPDPSNNALGRELVAEGSLLAPGPSIPAVLLALVGLALVLARRRDG